jgi:hypothetical protein
VSIAEERRAPIAAPSDTQRESLDGAVRALPRSYIILGIVIAFAFLGGGAFAVGRATAPVDGIAANATEHYDEICPTAIANLRLSQQGISNAAPPGGLTPDQQQRLGVLRAQEQSRISVCDTLDDKAQWRAGGASAP